MSANSLLNGRMIEGFLFVNESTSKAGKMSPFDDQNKFLTDVLPCVTSTSRWSLGDLTSETFDLLEEHDQLLSPPSIQEDEIGDSRPPYDLMSLIKKAQSRSHCTSSDRASHRVAAHRVISHRDVHLVHLQTKRY